MARVPCDRRALLTGAAALAATVALPAIAAPRSVDRLIVEKIEVFTLKVNRRGNWIIIRLHTANGLTGLGDASHGHDDAATIAFLQRFAALWRGRSIFEVNAFRRAVTAPIAAAGSSGAAVVAASAIEQALWDLIGHALDRPVYDLFGGALRTDIPLYANINRSTEPRTPAGFAEMAQKAVAAGFQAVKLAPFDALPANFAERNGPIESLVADGIAAAGAVRQAIGADRQLMIDAHSRFTRTEGLSLLPRLVPLDLAWLEETTPADPIADLVAINRAASMPTAGGEALYGVGAFLPYLTSGAVDIAMPDVKLCGGMTALKGIASIAEAADLAVSPHGPASPIGNLAAAHVAATLPTFTILEHAYGEVPWRADIIDPPEQAAGALRLSNQPGFGVKLNERNMKAWLLR